METITSVDSLRSICKQKPQKNVSFHEIKECSTRRPCEVCRKFTHSFCEGYDLRKTLPKDDLLLLGNDLSKIRRIKHSACDDCLKPQKKGQLPKQCLSCFQAMDIYLTQIHESKMLLQEEEMSEPLSNDDSESFDFNMSDEEDVNFEDTDDELDLSSDSDS